MSSPQWMLCCSWRQGLLRSAACSTICRMRSTSSHWASSGWAACCLVKASTSLKCWVMSVDSTALTTSRRTCKWGSEVFQPCSRGACARMARATAPAHSGLRMHMELATGLLGVTYAEHGGPHQPQHLPERGRESTQKAVLEQQCGCWAILRSAMVVRPAVGDACSYRCNGCPIPWQAAPVIPCSG